METKASKKCDRESYPERERMIVRTAVWTQSSLDGQEMTQKEVADLLGISQSYISTAGEEDHRKTEKRDRKIRVDGIGDYFR